MREEVLLSSLPLEASSTGDTEVTASYLTQKYIKNIHNIKQTVVVCCGVYIFM